MGTWDTKDTLMMGNRDTSYGPRGWLLTVGVRMRMGTKKGAPDDVPSIDSSLYIICPSFHGGGACGMVWGVAGDGWTWKELRFTLARRLLEMEWNCWRLVLHFLEGNSKLLERINAIKLWTIFMRHYSLLLLRPLCWANLLHTTWLLYTRESWRCCWLVRFEGELAGVGLGEVNLFYTLITFYVF